MVILHDRSSQPNYQAPEVIPQVTEMCCEHSIIVFEFMKSGTGRTYDAAG
jgi:hypothetical protein